MQNIQPIFFCATYEYYKYAKKSWVTWKLSWNMDHKFTAIGISKSWLKEYNFDRHVLDGYKAVHKYRSLRSGGGVSIFIQDSLEYLTREDLCHQNNSIESVFIKIDNNQFEKDRNVIIGVVYRPPNSDINMFNGHVSELLTQIKSEKKICLVSWWLHISFWTMILMGLHRNLPI